MKKTTSPVPCPTWQAVLDGVAEFFAAPGDPFVPDTLCCRRSAMAATSPSA